MKKVFELELLRGYRDDWERVSFPGQEEGNEPHPDFIDKCLQRVGITKARVTQVYLPDEDNTMPTITDIKFDKTMFWWHPSSV